MLPQRLQHANPRLHFLLAGGACEVGPLLGGNGKHVSVGAGPGRRGGRGEVKFNLRFWLTNLKFSCSFLYAPYHTHGTNTNVLTKLRICVPLVGVSGVCQWVCPRMGYACNSLSSALLHVADVTQLDAPSRLVGGAWGWGRE